MGERFRDLHATCFTFWASITKKLTYRYTAHDFQLIDAFGRGVHDVLA